MSGAVSISRALQWGGLRESLTGRVRTVDGFVEERPDYCNCKGQDTQGHQAGEADLCQSTDLEGPNDGESDGHLDQVGDSPGCLKERFLISWYTFEKR